MTFFGEEIGGLQSTLEQPLSWILVTTGWLGPGQGIQRIPVRPWPW